MREASRHVIIFFNCREKWARCKNNTSVEQRVIFTSRQLLPVYFRVTMTSRAAQWCVTEEWGVTSLLPGHARIGVKRYDYRIMSSILRKVIENFLESLKRCDPWIVSSSLCMAI